MTLSLGGPMRIGIISDTHRNTQILHDVATWMVERKRVGMIFHLGDDFTDVACLEDLGVNVIQVPGLYDEAYKNGSVSSSCTENVLGLSILLIHSIEKDLRENDRVLNQIICHGHTHKHELKIEDGVLYLNPGHCKGHIDKQQEASFAILEIQDEHVRVEILNLEFEIIAEMKMLREGNGLYRE